MLEDCQLHATLQNSKNVAYMLIRLCLQLVFFVQITNGNHTSCLLYGRKYATFVIK